MHWTRRTRTGMGEGEAAGADETGARGGLWPLPAPSEFVAVAAATFFAEDRSNAAPTSAAHSAPHSARAGLREYVTAEWAALLAARDPPVAEGRAAATPAGGGGSVSAPACPGCRATALFWALNNGAEAASTSRFYATTARLLALQRTVVQVENAARERRRGAAAPPAEAGLAAAAEAAAQAAPVAGAGTAEPMGAAGDAAGSEAEGPQALTSPPASPAKPAAEPPAKPAPEPAKQPSPPTAPPPTASPPPTAPPQCLAKTSGNCLVLQLLLQGISHTFQQHDLAADGACSGAESAAGESTRRGRPRPGVSAAAPATARPTRPGPDGATSERGDVGRRGQAAAGAPAPAEKRAPYSRRRRRAGAASSLEDLVHFGNLIRCAIVANAAVALCSVASIAHCRAVHVCAKVVRELVRVIRRPIFTQIFPQFAETGGGAGDAGSATPLHLFLREWRGFCYILKFCPTAAVCEAIIRDRVARHSFFKLLKEFGRFHHRDQLPPTTTALKAATAPKAMTAPGAARSGSISALPPPTAPTAPPPPLPALPSAIGASTTLPPPPAAAVSARPSAAAASAAVDLVYSVSEVLLGSSILRQRLQKSMHSLSHLTRFYAAALSLVRASGAPPLGGSDLPTERARQAGAPAAKARLGGSPSALRPPPAAVSTRSVSAPPFSEDGPPSDEITADAGCLRPLGELAADDSGTSDEDGEELAAAPGSAAAGAAGAVARRAKRTADSRSSDAVERFVQRLVLETAHAVGTGAALPPRTVIQLLVDFAA